MTRREEIEAELVSIEIEAEFIDGLDEAILGFSRRINLDYVLCYSYEKSIEIIMKDGNLSYSDAVEHMEYNVVGSYVGEMTPIFVKKFDFDE